jgi:hypothetical protein
MARQRATDELITYGRTCTRQYIAGHANCAVNVQTFNLHDSVWNWRTQKRLMKRSSRRRDRLSIYEQGYETLEQEGFPGKDQCIIYSNIVQ